MRGPFIAKSEQRIANDAPFHSRYIANVLSLVREHRWFFLTVALAALALRLFFFVDFPAVTDDSHVYADLATNWLQHGIYGQTQAPLIVPTDTRLPGYPAFLAMIFWLFGAGNFKAVMLAQIVFDLATCLIVADIARRMLSTRAAKIAFLLASLCPFLANYSVAVLTETLEIFFTVLALDCAVAALNRMHAGEAGINQRWAATGVAIAACILLRPDGGILLIAVAFYVVAAARKTTIRGAVVAGVIITAFALAPLAPWTIRNFRTLHHFQPLAPRYANEPEELTPVGFNRWVKTWMAEYASVEEIYWSVQGDRIDPAKLPARALDEPPSTATTLAVIADYNQTPEQELTPQLDARFGQLAAIRIRAHPIRYYVVLPLLRVADMWLRPRTEILSPDVRWWEFNDDVKHSIMAAGFGVLNLAYVGAALLALASKPSRRSLGVRRSGLRWPGLLIGFVLLRSAFLLTLENPEPRYTLECYPAVIVFAAAYLAQATKRERHAGSHFSNPDSCS